MKYFTHTSFKAHVGNVTSNWKCHACNHENLMSINPVMHLRANASRDQGCHAIRMNKPKQGCHAIPWDAMHPCLGALPIHLTMWETQRTCFKLAVAIHLWLHSPCIFYKVLLCRNVRQCHSLSSAPGRMTRRLCQQLSIHPPQSPYSGPTSMFCGSQSGPPNGPWPCAYNT